MRSSTSTAWIIWTASNDVWYSENVTASASSSGGSASAVVTMYIFPVGLKVGDHGGTHLTGHYSGRDAIVTGSTKSPNDPGVGFMVLNWPDYAVGKSIQVSCSGTYSYSYTASPYQSMGVLDSYGLVDLEGNAARTNNELDVWDPDLKMAWDVVVYKRAFTENCTLSWQEKEYSFRIIYQP